MSTRKGIQRAGFALMALWVLIQLAPYKSLAEDSVEAIVYGTYAALNMGYPGEINRRDYYVNIGSKDGVKVGSKIEVIRKIPTYDLLTRKLQKDMLFPVGILKVIHVEPGVAVARIEKVLSEETAPALTPRAVMVGDLIRLAK